MSGGEIKTLRSIAAAISMTLLVALTACVTIGPKVKDRITLVEQTTKRQRVVEVAKVLDDVKVLIAVKVDGDLDHRTEERDLEGYNVIRPDIAVARGLRTPFVAEEKVVKVRRLDGEIDRLNIGGWYIIKSGERVEE